MNRTLMTTYPPLDYVRSSEAFRSVLHAHEQQSLRDNVVVQVLAIDPQARVVVSTVHQCLHGMMRRQQRGTELACRAERALEPLLPLGWSLMISVLPGPAAGPSRSHWPAAVWQWLGHPLARRGYRHRLHVQDPFGWRRAVLKVGLLTVLPSTTLSSCPLPERTP